MTSSSTLRSRNLPLADLLITASLGLFFGGALLSATEWSMRAGLMPRLVTAFGLFMACLHLLLLLIRSRMAPVAPAEDSDSSDAAPEYAFANAGRSAWAASLGWLAAFFISLYVLGLFITVPLFAVTYLRFVAGTSWRFSALYATVAWSVLYLVFERLLELPTPSGLF